MKIWASRGTIVVEAGEITSVTINKTKNQRGFTLIELLLVISIISLMSSSVFASVKQAAVRARDARRTQDMENLKSALLLYYANNGKFPCQAGGSSTHWDPDFLKPLVTDKLLARIPVDPINDDFYHYDYITFSNPSYNGCGQYALLADYTENPPAVCTGGGAWSSSDQHCHIMIPEPMPSPCLNPYYLDNLKNLPGNQGCTNWMDDVDDW